MNLLHAVSHYRDLKQDRESPANVIVGRLILAEQQVFHRIGGIENDEVRAALQTEYLSTISAGRQYVILPGQEIVAPVAYLDGKRCLMASAGDKGALEDNFTYRPAAVVERNKITFYPDPALTKGTLPVRIGYVRALRSILFLGGYQVTGGTAGFGIAGKNNLISFDFIWPDKRVAVAANELAGAVLSVQWDEVMRRDYTIEENDAGILTRVFVNSSYSSAEWPVVDLDTAVKGVQAIVHRFSDLPEKFHGLIVETAAGVAPMEGKK